MIRLRRRALLASAALAAAALVIAPVAPATAAPAVGWVRLAHMSPDTAAVNVTLSSLSGDVTLFRLKNVAYGAVSKYMRLPQGTYALAMRPAGSTDPDATPIVSGSVTVKAGQAETVAAIGLNKDLKTKVFSDDLAAAGGSGAKVRVFQAAVSHDSVSVTADGKSVASDAAFGSVGDYVGVPAGTATVKMTGGSDTTTMSQPLAAGSAHTLFIIDTKSGGLTAVAALDSSSATETPVGSLAAGGGGLAAGGQDAAGLLAGLAAVGGVAAAAVLVRRRSDPTRV